MKIEKSMLMSEGAGAEVQRLFPLRADRMNYDPFVLWDHFLLEVGMGFPTHPHRGFEAITYIFEGSMAHKDNLGNESRVYPGGAQRFTAGRGLEHSEMPDTQGRTSGIQLWINLPRRLKTLEPDYQQVDATEIPETEIDGGVVRTIVGEGSPVALHTPVNYLDISLNEGASYHHEVAEGFRGLLYLVEGQLRLEDGNVLDAGDALFMESEEVLNLVAQQLSRFMLCLGTPHREPIRQYGPFVD